MIRKHQLTSIDFPPYLVDLKLAQRIMNSVVVFLYIGIMLGSTLSFFPLAPIAFPSSWVLLLLVTSLLIDSLLPFSRHKRLQLPGPALRVLPSLSCSRSSFHGLHMTFIVFKV